MVEPEEEEEEPDYLPLKSKQSPFSAASKPPTNMGISSSRTWEVSGYFPPRAPRGSQTARQAESTPRSSRRPKSARPMAEGKSLTATAVYNCRNTPRGTSDVTVKIEGRRYNDISYFQRIRTPRSKAPVPAAVPYTKPASPFGLSKAGVDRWSGVPETYGSGAAHVASDMTPEDMARGFSDAPAGATNRVAALAAANRERKRAAAAGELNV